MLKIRASSLDDVMTGSRDKNDPLGATCRKKIREIWMADVWKRYPKEIMTDRLKKGTANEEAGITLLSQKLRTFFVKNESHLNNDYFTGTPDIVKDGIVYDIKCSWSLDTFMEAKPDTYYWQLQAYMDLTGCKTSKLVFCLTDTPDELIENEIRRMMYNCVDPSMLEDVREYCYNQLKFPDIPIESKVKIFDFGYSHDGIEKAYNKIDLCRDYYNSLHL